MHSQYGGMTVNERLFAAGLLDAFDTAAKRRARDEMIRILARVELDGPDGAAIVDTILADPTKYGV